MNKANGHETAGTFWRLPAVRWGWRGVLGERGWRDVLGERGWEAAGAAHTGPCERLKCLHFFLRVTWGHL